MLVMFCVINTSSDSNRILASTKRIADRIYMARLCEDGINEAGGLDPRNPRMLFGNTVGPNTFEMFWDISDHFSLDDIRQKVDFPELMAIEAFQQAPADEPEQETTSSIIANVGRVVAPDEQEDISF